MTTASAVGARTEASLGQGDSSNLYTVQRGDTLWDIAQRHGVSLNALIEANPQIVNPHRIMENEAIAIPSGGGVAAGGHTYTVSRGETLWAIGQKFGVDWRVLAQVNGVSNPNTLQIGQTLRIEGAGATAGTRAPRAPAGGDPVAPARTAPAAAAPVAADGVPAPGRASVRAAAYAEAHVEPRSLGKCYAYVKAALQQAGVVGDYIPGVPAKGAGPELEKRGFVNILDNPGANIRSPYDAPVGAVLVYGASSGATDPNAKYGHIEIRTQNGFASDYASPRARTGPAGSGLEGRGRVLIGVYVKPDAQAQAAAPPATDGLYAARNLKLGANEAYRPAILEAAQRTGMAPQTVAAIINAEAARDRNGVWQADSASTRSQARGLTQFIPGTWVGEATRAGSLLNQEAKALGLVDDQNRVVAGRREELLNLRFDGRVAILAGADHARHNIQSLTEARLAPADASQASLAKYAYLAHHEGLQGARNYLRGELGYIGRGAFNANVPDSQKQAYLNATGGNVSGAYQLWLRDYVDANLDVRRFMTNAQGVQVPTLRSLEP